MPEAQVINLLQIAREITVTGLLIAVIYGFVSGKLVTRFQYDEMRRICEERIRRLLDDHE